MPGSALLFGRGPLGVVALDALMKGGYQVSAVVPSHAEISGTQELVDHARSLGVPVIDKAGAMKMRGTFTDVGVSVFFDGIFSRDDIARFGTLVNLHNSPLPRYRGVRPINWALKNNEPFHGVTLHDVAERVDAGPILAQTIFAIDPSQDEVEDVYQRCLRHGEDLLNTYLPLVETCPRFDQDETAATYYGKSDIPLLGDRSTLRRVT